MLPELLQLIKVKTKTSQFDLELYNADINEKLDIILTNKKIL